MLPFFVLYLVAFSHLKVFTALLRRMNGYDSDDAVMTSSQQRREAREKRVLAAMNFSSPSKSGGTFIAFPKGAGVRL